MAKYNEFINRVEQCVAQKLKEISSQQSSAINFALDLRGQSEQDCTALASAVAEILNSAAGDIAKEIQRDHAGDYVPTNPRGVAPDVRAKIKDEYNGTNLPEVMERYGVSRATVWRCVKREY